MDCLWNIDARLWSFSFHYQVYDLKHSESQLNLTQAAVMNKFILECRGVEVFKDSTVVLARKGGNIDKTYRPIG